MYFSIRLAKRSYARVENFGRTQGCEDVIFTTLCKEKIFLLKEHGANAGFQGIVSSSEG